MPFRWLLHDTFTHAPRAPIRERRRKRWTEVYGRSLAALGILLAFLQQRDIIVLFPERWRPYIVGASAAFALIWGSEYAERHHDWKRYQERLERESKRIRENMPL